MGPRTLLPVEREGREGDVAEGGGEGEGRARERI